MEPITGYLDPIGGVKEGVSEERTLKLRTGIGIKSSGEEREPEGISA